MTRPTVWKFQLDSESTMYVSGYFSPGRPGRMYLRNGDPGYPEEPAEIEIASIELQWAGYPRIDLYEVIDWLDGWEKLYQLVEQRIQEEQEAEDAARADREISE